MTMFMIKTAERCIRAQSYSAMSHAMRVVNWNDLAKLKIEKKTSESMNNKAQVASSDGRSSVDF